MTRKVTDQRNPRVPLDKPPFGPPVNARMCEACERWFPFKAFYAGRDKPTRRCCIECREAGLRAPAKTHIEGRWATASYRRRQAARRKARRR